MAPHTQTGSITIKQPFPAHNHHHQWPWNSGTGGGGSAGGGTTSGGTTPNGVGMAGGQGETLTEQESRSSSGAAGEGGAAQSAAVPGVSSSSNGTTAVSPSNKLKRQQAATGASGKSVASQQTTLLATTTTAAAAAAAAAGSSSPPTTPAPTTNGVQTDGTGKSNSSSSNSSSNHHNSNSSSRNGAAGQEGCAGNSTVGAKRSRPNEPPRIACKSVGTNTATRNGTGGGPPALVAVGSKPATGSPVSAVTNQNNGGSGSQNKLTQQLAIVSAAAPVVSTAAAAAAELAAAKTNGNKITGYFKSQMKSTNAFNTLKRSIKTVAGRAITISSTELLTTTTTTTTTAELRTGTGTTVLQQKSIIKTSASSSSASPPPTGGNNSNNHSNNTTTPPPVAAPFSGPNLDKYLKLFHQQQQQQQQLLVKNSATAAAGSTSTTTTATLEAVAVATLAAAAAAATSQGAAAVAAASKKVERKTARIAPTVSATRKICHQGGLGVGGAGGVAGGAAGQSKKPVTIAPRTTAANTGADGPKTAPVSGLATGTSSSSLQQQTAQHTSKVAVDPLSTAKMQPSSSQQQPPPSTVLLTAIRLPTATPPGGAAANTTGSPVAAAAPNVTPQYKPIAPQPPGNSMMSSSGAVTKGVNPATAAVFQFQPSPASMTTAVGPPPPIPVSAAGTMVAPLPNLVQISNLLPLAAAQQQQQQQALKLSTTNGGGGPTITSSVAAAFAASANAAAAANMLVSANGMAAAAAAARANSTAMAGPGAGQNTTPQLIMNATIIKIHQIQQQQQQAAAAAAAAQAQHQVMAAASSLAHGGHQQQSFTMEAAAMNMNFSGMFAKPTTTVVPYSAAAACPVTTAVTKAIGVGHPSAAAMQSAAAALYSPQAFAAAPQQLLMTPTGGIFVNTAAIPTMFTSAQLSAALTQATATATIPALHPLQPTGGGGGAGGGHHQTASGNAQLPNNITAIIQQNVAAAAAIQQQQHSLLANISPAMLNSLQSQVAAVSAGATTAAAGKLGVVQTLAGSAPAATAQFVPISSALYAAAAAAQGATIQPSTILSSGLGTIPSSVQAAVSSAPLHHHQQQQQHHHHTIVTSVPTVPGPGALSPPPLVATVPTFSTTSKPIMNALMNGGQPGSGLGKMAQATTTAAAATTATMLLPNEPPGLVPVQPLPQQHSKPLTVAKIGGAGGVTANSNTTTVMPKLVRSTSLTMRSGLGGTTQKTGRSNGSTQTTPVAPASGLLLGVSGVPTMSDTQHTGSSKSPPALNPLTLDCGSSNDSGIVANSSDSEDKSLTIDLCSPGSPDSGSPPSVVAKKTHHHHHHHHHHHRHHHRMHGLKDDDSELAAGSQSSSSPLSSSSDDSEDQLGERAPIGTSASVAPAVVPVSPFPPPLRLLSDVAVAAAEAEAAFHQRLLPPVAAVVALPTTATTVLSLATTNTTTTTVATCQKSPKSTVLELIRRKHPPLTLMDVDQPGQPLSVASSATSDLQEEYGSSQSPSDGDGQQDASSSSQQQPGASFAAAPSIATDLLSPLAPEATCARSPILSQPKTIRFPVPSGTAPHHHFGRKGFRRSGDGRLYGACYWRDCDSKFDSASQLVDHLAAAHINTQTGPTYACLWDGCKVHNKECTKFNWLEQHVRSHGCTKLHKCIVEGCGMRFATRTTFVKHVHGHFAGADSNGSGKRSSTDPPVPKVLRKTGKKLRYRRQPWSARRFDFFDSGVMEGLQHRLVRTGSLASGQHGAIVFRGSQVARRQAKDKAPEVLIRWYPAEILPDQWLPEENVQLEKQVHIHELTHEQQNDLLDYLKHDRLSVQAGTGPSNPFAALHEFSLNGGSGSGSGSNSNLSSSSSSWSSISSSTSMHLSSSSALFRFTPKQQRKPQRQLSSVSADGSSSASYSNQGSKPGDGGASSSETSTGFSSIFSNSLTALSSGSRSFSAVSAAGLLSSNSSSSSTATTTTTCRGAMMLSSSSSSSSSSFCSSASAVQRSACPKPATIGSFSSPRSTASSSTVSQPAASSSVGTSASS
ncbi:zinc finger protein jing homolog [Anopheles bellator]|uniref:zinc finger protein jing homolog n=1 Tax=Anopheles bellator TaxID=139047 RepID=UPI002647BE24|nr:zinc finger protein jing homolog [Anopheles bellator]